MLQRAGIGIVWIGRFSRSDEPAPAWAWIGHEHRLERWPAKCQVLCKAKPRQSGSRPCNFKLPADVADGSFFDFAMARKAGDLAILRVKPYGVRAALAIEDATVLAQVPFDVGALHLGDVEDLANGSGRDILLRQLPLALKYELQRFAKIRLGFFESLTL